MNFDELLLDTIKDVEPILVSLPQKVYEKEKECTLQAAEATGKERVLKFMVAVFDIVDGKRKAT